MNEKMEYSKTPADYVGMFKRRRKAFFIPAIAVFAASVLLAFGLPAMYQSEAKILIQQQSIPRDFIRSTVTSFAAQQIQTINARVLTVRNISEIVRKFNLYDQSEDDISTRLPGTELATLFREDMKMEMVSADVIDPKSGKPTEVTIAFSLSFKSPSSTTAQKVTNELVTLFLNENLGIRTDQAESTEEFFVSESEALNNELKAMEQRLAEFKTANEGSLPELYQFNLGVVDRTERQIEDAKLRIKQLTLRKMELASQLTQLSPTAPVRLSSGQVVLSDADRLKALQAEYRTKAAIYNSNHPDVVRLEREIQALQSQLGTSTDLDDLRKQLQEQKQRLTELEGKYTDNHQDVRATRQLIALLEANFRQQNASDTPLGESKPDNPAYILLETQIGGVDLEIQSARKKITELQQRLEHHEELIKRAPHVEKEYHALLRDYNNATRKYDVVKSNSREAALSRNLEQSRKGERFILIEPPARPSDPVSPNRPAIIFLGLVLGAGIGLGFALLREMADSAIQGARELGAIMGEAPFVSIPYINTAEDDAIALRNRRRAIYGCVGAFIALLTYLHFFYLPLDVMYFSTLNRIGLS